MGSVACPQCGTVNPAGARFCRGCGLNLTQHLHQSGSLHAPAPAGAAPVAGGAPTLARGPGQSGVPPQGVMAQALTGQIGTSPLVPGATLQGGRYVIERALGSGGMGSVFLARDTHVNNKPVVIKEMASSYATEAERREAEAEFQAEMATLAGLSHPNIPGISDFFTESNRHFAVQEYVAGQDLQKAIEAAQAPNSPPRGLPEKQVLAWIAQVLDVLGYLEAQNPQVIHRDIKPGNIIVDANNRVRVVDFGIASHKFRPGSTRAVGPQVSTALGTPGYAPKEQFTGQETTLSDLYALGATMHHLLTGRDPTKAQPLWQYPPVRMLNPTVSEATARIVAHALQNDEKKRYQDAAAMKRDVLRVLNPPGALSTFRGRAVALLVVLLFVALVGGGSYLYARLQPQARPTGYLSDGGSVAFDTDQVGLAALGVSASDGKAWAQHKVQASKDMAAGNTAGAISEYQQAVRLNPADAESRIYLEDNRVADNAPYKIVLGGSFGPAPTGGGDDVSVGRQNLQGAYTAQKRINDAGGINGHPLYLVLANDASSTAGATAAAQDIAKRGESDALAFVGFAFSSRTQKALSTVTGAHIPEISPTASTPGLAGASAYFFRTCPSDRQQAQYGVDYLVHTLLGNKPNPVVAVVGAPADTYANGLQTLAEGEAKRLGATVVPVDYVRGQTDFSTQAQTMLNERVDGVYFAGYAPEALLFSQAMDNAGVSQTVPIMSDDGFYNPSAFVQYGTVPKGRFHFTSFFYPDEYNLLTSAADKKRIVDMENLYKANFHKAGTPLGGYGTSRVSADTALTYDAVETLAEAINRLGGGPVTRAAIQQQLSTMGATLSTPPYQGISGRIQYATANRQATGDPIDKALVVMHLDAQFGRSHMDRLLGAY